LWYRDVVELLEVGLIRRLSSYWDHRYEEFINIQLFLVLSLHLLCNEMSGLVLYKLPSEVATTERT
jgi:hypothetical protein